MKNKYIKSIYAKPIIVAMILVLFIFGIFVTTKLSSKRIEVGALPSCVTWNKKTYTVSGKMVNSVWKKLGVSEGTGASQRNIYSIPNVNPDKEIAIEQLGKTYFEAVAKK